MAITQEGRFGGTRTTDDADRVVSREYVDGNFGRLFDSAARFDQGLSGNRPQPSIPGRLYASLDTGSVDYDTGTEWVQTVSPRMDAAPTSGRWERGQRVMTRSPSAGGYIGWVCVASGTPGTWRRYGAIEA